MNMTRINRLAPEHAEGKTKTLYENVHKQLGTVPNLFQTLGQSSAVLEFYLNQVSALAGGVLKPAVREKIALVTASANACDYCASAHTVLGKMAGIDEAELAQNLLGRSEDPKTERALVFAKRIVQTRGKISDAELSALRSEGYTDAEIVEIIAHVGLNIFTNYFNHIAETEIDFPLVTTSNLNHA